MYLFTSSRKDNINKGKKTHNSPTEGILHSVAGDYRNGDYLKNPILKIGDFSANMCRMNMIFNFLNSISFQLSLECFFIIFG